LKIEEAQDMMRRIYLERDRARGIEGTLKRTFEELDELKEAIENKGSAQALSDEFADVFAWLCSLGNLLEVDISDAFFNKYNNSCSKCKKSPCVCPEPLDLK
jgi:NTP pyrophosphatase (non-canonical NTP hydrolase)